MTYVAAKQRFKVRSTITDEIHIPQQMGNFALTYPQVRISVWKCLVQHGDP